MAAKKAFGGKMIDLKSSGLGEMSIGELFPKKKTIAPTDLMGAFWKAVRRAEINDKTCYFGTPDELGETLDKSELKILKAKLDK